MPFHLSVYDFCYLEVQILMSTFLYRFRHTLRQMVSKTGLSLKPTLFTPNICAQAMPLNGIFVSEVTRVFLGKHRATTLQPQWTQHDLSEKEW